MAPLPDISAWLPGLLTGGGLAALVALLKWQRQDAGANVAQSQEVLAGMKVLIAQLFIDLDRVRAERDAERAAKERTEALHEAAEKALDDCEKNTVRLREEASRLERLLGMRGKAGGRNE